MPKNVSSDLSKLSNVVDKHVTKKTVCNESVNKLFVINTKIRSTCGFVNKTQYDSNKQRIEKKVKDYDRKMVNKNDYKQKLKTGYLIANSWIPKATEI